MPVYDFDDHHPANDAMPWMLQLKEINPQFRVTLFTVPALCTPDWLRAHPGWVELVPHGWEHPHPRECQEWTRERMLQLLDEPIIQEFASPLGWKSPGWQTSPGVYQACLERGVWIADQHLADHIRPDGMSVYFYEDGPNHHGHVQNVCGNGIEETWEQLKERVKGESEFLFASEAARVRPHTLDTAPA